MGFANLSAIFPPFISPRFATKEKKIADMETTFFQVFGGSCSKTSSFSTLRFESLGAIIIIVSRILRILCSSIAVHYSISSSIIFYPQFLFHNNGRVIISFGRFCAGIPLPGFKDASCNNKCNYQVGDDRWHSPV